MTIRIDKQKCLTCGGCVSVCPVAALILKNGLEWNKEKCTMCRTCVKFCPVGALKSEKE